MRHSTFWFLGVMLFYQAFNSASCGAYTYNGDMPTTQCRIFAGCAYMVAEDNSVIVGWFNLIFQAITHNFITLAYVLLYNFPLLIERITVDLDHKYAEFVAFCRSPGGYIQEALLPQPHDCLVHKTMLCNGIPNCDDCWDESWTECMNSSCHGGKKKNFS